MNNFKCDDCGSEVINFELNNIQTKKCISLTRFPDEIDNSMIWWSQNLNIIKAYCDGCNKSWGPEIDLEELKDSMKEAGVVF